MGDLVCMPVKAVIHKGENTSTLHDLTSQSPSVGALGSRLQQKGWELIWIRSVCWL